MKLQMMLGNEVLRVKYGHCVLLNVFIKDMADLFLVLVCSLLREVFFNASILS